MQARGLIRNGTYTCKNCYVFLNKKISSEINLRTIIAMDEVTRDFFTYVPRSLSASSSPIYCSRANGYRCSFIISAYFGKVSLFRKKLWFASGPTLQCVSGSPEEFWTACHNHFVHSVDVQWQNLPLAHGLK